LFGGKFLQALDLSPPGNDISMGEASTEGSLKCKAEQGPTGQVLPAKHPQLSDHHLNADTKAPFMSLPPPSPPAIGGLHQKSVLGVSDVTFPVADILRPVRPENKDNCSTNDAAAVQVCLQLFLLACSFSYINCFAEDARSVGLAQKQHGHHKICHTTTRAQSTVTNPQ
jgi:hypothetical protein